MIRSSLKIKIRRFIIRLKHAFRFKEIVKWEYETCDKCGIDYRLSCAIKDSVWVKVNNRKEGCLCINCFLKIAQEKKVGVKREDILWLWVFDPEDKSSGCFDLIDEKRV